MAPIDALPSDLLLEIFSLNATTEYDPPATRRNAFGPSVRLPLSDLHAETGLDFARCSSQVCRTWRKTIINSPRTWGRILNISFLGLSHERWWNEVLRRTGRSTLNISVELIFQSLDPREPAVSSLFLSILEREWHRFHSIDIRIHRDADAEISHKISQLLQRPAPASLQSFKMAIASIFESDPPCRNMNNIFANEITSLREFHSENLARFQLKAPWINQLKKVKIMHPVIPPSLQPYINTENFSLSVPLILDALAEMPFIEDFSIRFVNLVTTEPVNQPIKVVQITRLKSLNIDADFHSLLGLLQGIAVPNPQYSLFTTVFSRSIQPVTILKADGIAMQTILSRYLNGFFSVGFVDELTILISKESVSISTPWIFYVTCPLDREASNLLPLIPSSPLTDGVLPRFLGELASSRLDTITFLSIMVDLSVLVKQDKHVTQIIIALRSLEVLEANTDFLDMLNTCLLPSSFFPRLREIRITYLSSEADKIILELLHRRKSMDVRGLELVCLGEVESARVDTLGAKISNILPDLKITWKDSQGVEQTYDCEANSR